jgi:N-methylhydantoinase A
VWNTDTGVVEGSERQYSLALDVGGTFTDVTAIDIETHEWWVAKVPSTPDEPLHGLFDAIERVVGRIGASPERIRYLFHATTLATNAILEGSWPATGLLTTRGFKYVLEIGRHDIPRLANMYSWQKPTRPVEPAMIFEVAGRLDATGAEIEPLRDDDVALAAAEFGRSGVRSCAVSLLHSYASAQHEERARSLLEQALPECAVSISSDVLPVFREYERTMITVLNAAVQPIMSVYLTQLRRRLEERRVHAAPWVMKSNGGLVGAAAV